MTAPIKLTKPQRRALTAIAAGGVRLHVARYGDRKETIGSPGDPITPAVYKRLNGSGLCHVTRAEDAGPWTQTWDIAVTPYGRDVLTGTVRQPIEAVALVSVDGVRVATRVVELDPYAWQLDDASERRHYLNRLAQRFLAERVTAAVHIGDAP